MTLVVNVRSARLMSTSGGGGGVGNGVWRLFASSTPETSNAASSTATPAATTSTVVEAAPAVVAKAESASFFSSLAQAGADVFESLHVATGLPYWGVIVGSTVVFRALLVPLVVQSMKNAQKMAKVRPHIERMQDELRKSGRNDPQAQARYAAEWAALKKEHDFSMGRQFLPVLAQLPGFLWFFSSVGAMIRSNPGMPSGGALWFVDLTTSDPFMRLNIATSAVMFLSFRLGAESGGVPAAQAGLIKVMGTVFPLLYLPFTYSFGQGLHLFWFTSAASAVSVNYLLRKTPVGTLLGVPPQNAQVVEETPVATFATKKEGVRAGLSASQLAKAHKNKHENTNTEKK